MFNFQFDENGNTLPTLSSSFPSTLHSKAKPKRSNKGDRNTKNVLAEEIEGNRGSETIETLLAFIENTENSTKKPNIINVNKNVINKSENKKKNAAGASKKESSLQKCSSLEELMSSSKRQEEEREKVSLRQKQVQKRSAGGDGREAMAKTASAQANNKRGERRSWGTEELNYLGEREVEKEARRPKEAAKVSGKVKNKADAATAASKQASIESIPASLEAAEFHVVTKKKKTKKRQLMEEQLQQHHHHHQQPSGSNASQRGGNGAAQPHSSRHQQQISSYNDRDIYLNSLTTKDNRRKSTSSVPPSDKSESSDVDSIRSLPIETAVRTSYADIARTASHTEKWSQAAAPAQLNDWPTVTSSAIGNKPISESPDASVSPPAAPAIEEPVVAPPRPALEDKSPTLARIVSEKPAASPSIASIVSGATPKHPDATPAPPTPSETVKSQLQKSKSVDSDKYSRMSMDQFPGLEKTIKPQKSHQNLPVAASMAATTQMPTMSQLLKSQTLPKPAAKKAAPPPTIASTNSLSFSNQKDDTKLVFVQNSAMADELANSSETNVFTVSGAVAVTSTIKKSSKKSNHQQEKCSSASNNHHHHSHAHSGATNRNNNGAHRPAVIIFNDNETISENVSPLLFGDFNDDILQLMKQDDQSHPSISPTTQSSPIPSATNAINSSANDSICGAGGPDDHCKAFTASPMSDAGYSSVHSRSTYSNESLDVHDKSGTNSIACDDFNNKMPTQIQTIQMNKHLNKKNNFNTILLNSNLNNDKISGLVSNQSINSVQSISDFTNNNAMGDDERIQRNNQHVIDANDHIQMKYCVKGAPNPVNHVPNAKQSDDCDPIDANNDAGINGRIIVCSKDLHVRYVDPPAIVSTAANCNHEMIVNFVGLGKLFRPRTYFSFSKSSRSLSLLTSTAWEDILHGASTGAARYYNGQ